MSNEEAFVNELIGYIFAYPDDDYMTMECLCRKLHKHGLIERKDGDWTSNFIKQADTTQTEIEGEWISCEERLPEEEGNYLVTFGAFAETINGEKVIFGDPDGSVAEIGYGCYERDIFWQPTAFGWYDLYTATPFDKRAIIAWKPLPEPWKGADDEVTTV